MSEIFPAQIHGNGTATIPKDIREEKNLKKGDHVLVTIKKLPTE